MVKWVYIPCLISNVFDIKQGIVLEMTWKNQFSSLQFF